MAINDIIARAMWVLANRMGAHEPTPFADGGVPTLQYRGPDGKIADAATEDELGRLYNASGELIGHNPKFENEAYGAWHNPEDQSALGYGGMKAYDIGEGAYNAAANLLGAISPVGSSEQGNMALQVPPMIPAIGGAFQRLIGTPEYYSPGERPDNRGGRTPSPVPLEHHPAVPGTLFNMSRIPELDKPIQDDVTTGLLSFFGGNAFNPLAVAPKGALAANALKSTAESGRLIHGTLADNIPSIKDNWLEPQAGHFVENAYGGEYGADLPSLVYMADPADGAQRAANAVRSHVANKLGKSFHDVTMDDIRDHGAIVTTRPDPSDTWRMNDDQTSTNLSGDTRHLYDDAATAEPGDYFSFDAVAPTGFLTGDRLVDFWKNNKLYSDNKPSILGSAIATAGERSQAFPANMTPFYGADVGPKGRIVDPAAAAEGLVLKSGLAGAPTDGFFNPATSALLQAGVNPKNTVAYYQKQMGSRGGKLPPGQWEKATEGLRPDDVIARDDLVKRIDALAPKIEPYAWGDNPDMASLGRSNFTDDGFADAQYQGFATEGPFENYTETAVGYPQQRYGADVDPDLAARQPFGPEREGAIPTFRDNHFEHPNLEGWYRTQDARSWADESQIGKDPSDWDAELPDLDVRILEELQPQRYQKMRDLGEGASQEQMLAWSKERDDVANEIAGFKKAASDAILALPGGRAKLDSAQAVNSMNIGQSLLRAARQHGVEGVDFDKFSTALDRYNHIGSQIAAGKKGVNPSPYTHDVNAATDFLLKNTVRDAAQDGIDRLAWTPGEVQAERYNKTLQNVKAVRYDRDSENLIIDRGRGYEGMGRVSKDKLAETVGKDVATRLLDDKAPRVADLPSMDVAELTFPQGMTLGGDGMKGFYGSGPTGYGGILTDRIRSLLKKISGQEPAVKPQTVIPGRATGNSTIVPTSRGQVTVRFSDGTHSEPMSRAEAEGILRSGAKNEVAYPSVDLSPEVRDTIKNTGLSLFTDTGKPSILGAAIAGAEHLQPLDMSHAARMKRAEEMGFDTSTPYYHGTDNAGFHEFDTSGKGETKGTGAWFTDSLSQAKTYTKGRGQLFEQPVTPEELATWKQAVDYHTKTSDTAKLATAQKTLAGLEKRMQDGSRNYVLFDDSLADIVHKWRGDTQLFSDTGKPSILGSAAATAGETPRGLAIENRGNGQYDVRVGGKFAGTASVANDGDGAFLSAISLEPDMQRQGIGSAVYDQIERDIGRPLVPSPLGLTDKAMAFWEKRLSAMPSQSRSAILDESRQLGRQYGLRDEHIDLRLKPLAGETPTPQGIKPFKDSAVSSADLSSSAANAITQPFWDAVRPLDAKLEGELGRAMDEWVGGSHDAIPKGLSGGLMMPERLEGLPPQRLDQMAAPVRDALRRIYGDTITVYRGEGGGNPSTGRAGNLMSYTTDPQVAERFAGAQTKAMSLIPDSEIAAAERQLAASGEVSIGGKTYRQEPGSSYIDIYDKDGQFVTDTDSLKSDLGSLNEWRSGLNADRDAALQNVRAVQIPVDQVVWATDRFGQKEIIAKAGAETLKPFNDSTPPAKGGGVKPFEGGAASDVPELQPLADKAKKYKDPTYYRKSVDGGVYYTTTESELKNKIKEHKESGWSDDRLNKWLSGFDVYGSGKPGGSDRLLAKTYSHPSEMTQGVYDAAAKKGVLTSDATDAVRWARILGTESDPRYRGGMTVYRAVKGDDIREGDWVTTSREYAEDHNRRYLNGEGNIVEMDVDGRDVLQSPTGNAEEAIYAPLELSAPFETYKKRKK